MINYAANMHDYATSQQIKGSKNPRPNHESTGSFSNIARLIYSSTATCSLLLNHCGIQFLECNMPHVALTMSSHWALMGLGLPIGI